MSRKPSHIGTLKFDIKSVEFQSVLQDGNRFWRWGGAGEAFAKAGASYAPPGIYISKPSLTKGKPGWVCQRLRCPFPISTKHVWNHKLYPLFATAYAPALEKFQLQQVATLARATLIVQIQAAPPTAIPRRRPIRMGPALAYPDSHRPDHPYSRAQIYFPMILHEECDGSRPTRFDDHAKAKVASAVGHRIAANTSR